MGIQTKEEAQKLLNGLDADQWEVKQVFKPGGQGFTFEVRHRESGERGVFKFLKIDSEKNRKRFMREISFLSDPAHAHPNIVRILDHSKDELNLWYVSELGEPFETYWAKLKHRYVTEPDELLKRGLAIIWGIAEGLDNLHSREEPIVHRDIKPGNIIFIDSRPVLIDFGTVFLPTEERLTDMDDAVGNRRFSHDSMMFRMEHVTPWLDIFQLSQVLIWMASENPVKNWQRPLDYRYVRYIDGLSTIYVNSLYAFTGICSDEAVSPKTAGEMINFLDSLFYFPDLEKVAGSKLPEISAALEKVKIEHGAKMARTETERLEKVHLIDSYATIYIKYHEELLDGIQAFLETLPAGGLSFSVTQDDHLTPGPFIQKCKNGIKEHNQLNLTRAYRIHESENIYFDFKLHSSFLYEWFKGGRNPFYFQLTTERKGAGNKSYGLAINKEGMLFEYEDRPLTVRDVVAEVSSWVADPEFWNF